MKLTSGVIYGVSVLLVAVVTFLFSRVCSGVVGSIGDTKDEELKRKRRGFENGAKGLLIGAIVLACVGVVTIIWSGFSG